MHIREFQDSDEAAVLELTIATFRPFYEQSFPAMMGHDRDLIQHQHGNWEQDYHALIPTLHRPAEGRHVAISESDDRSTLLGYIAWKPGQQTDSSEIDVLAVEPSHRHQGTGTALLRHALDNIQRAGIHFVGLGTGGDEFHAPARRLYETFGFHPIPMTGYLRRL